MKKESFRNVSSVVSSVNQPTQLITGELLTARAKVILGQGTFDNTSKSRNFGRKFRASRGVCQGDISSPVIFNIMVDAVLRYHSQQLRRIGLQQVDPIFYADDGLLAGTDSNLLQKSLNVITDGFASIGLKMNAIKTEYMVATGSEGRVLRSSNASMRRNTGMGLT